MLYVSLRTSNKSGGLVSIVGQKKEGNMERQRFNDIKCMLCLRITQNKSAAYLRHSLTPREEPKWRVTMGCKKWIRLKSPRRENWECSGLSSMSFASFSIINLVATTMLMRSGRRNATGFHLPDLLPGIQSDSQSLMKCNWAVVGWNGSKLQM